jgi:hypothetical protein
MVEDVHLVVPQIEVDRVPAQAVPAQTHSTPIRLTKRRSVGRASCNRKANLLAGFQIELPCPTYLSLEGHDQTVWAVAFSPDGKYVATGSLDQTAKIWDASSGTLLQTFPVSFPVCPWPSALTARSPMTSFLKA